MFPVAVLAGGIGSRLASVTADRFPKVLVEVAGRPFIDLKLRNLREAGFSEVVLLVGHQADQIVAHVGDGRRFGLKVAYSADGARPRGTGGAIKEALHLLPDQFWVTYGDTLLEVDVTAAERAFAAHDDWRSLMTVLENRNQWQLSNVQVLGDLVVAYDKSRPSEGSRFIDYGLLLFEGSAFTANSEDNFDLAVVLRDLIRARVLGAYVVHERFYDVGTPEGLAATRAHLARATTAGPVLSSGDDPH